MSILVTGGAGYIGSHTVKALKHENLRPIVLDNFVNGHEYIVRDILKVPYIMDIMWLTIFFDAFPSPYGFTTFDIFSYSFLFSNN